MIRIGSERRDKIGFRRRTEQLEVALRLVVCVEADFGLDGNARCGSSGEVGIRGVDDGETFA